MDTLMKVAFWACASLFAARGDGASHGHGVQALTADAPNKAIGCLLALASHHEVIDLFGLIWAHDVQASPLWMLHDWLLV